MWAARTGGAKQLVTALKHESIRLIHVHVLALKLGFVSRLVMSWCTKPSSVLLIALADAVLVRNRTSGNVVSTNDASPLTCFVRPVCTLAFNFGQCSVW